MEKLYVVTAISNPQNFKRRYELYFKFRDRIMNNQTAILYTVNVREIRFPIFTNRSGWEVIAQLY